MESKIRYIFTTPEKYNNMVEKDDAALYFLTNGELYKGDISYSGNMQIIDNSSIPMVGVADKIYANVDTKELITWKDGEWVPLIPQVVDNVNISKGTSILTKDAIGEYIESLVSDGVLAAGASGPLANVDCSKVRTSSDIQLIDQSIGKYKPGNIIKAGTSLEEILTNMCTRIINAIYVDPVVKLSPTLIRVEAGTTKKLLFRILYDKADGGDVESVLFLKGLNNIYGDPIFFSKHIIKEYITPEPVTIGDSDLLQYKVIVNYKEGHIKTNNLGIEQPENHVKAGVIEDVCQCIGERLTWYHSSSSLDRQYNKSNEIRGITNKILGVKKGDTFNIDISKGEKQVVISHPKSLGILESIKSKTFNMDLKDSFIMDTVMVEGANGYRSIEYYVYKYTPSVPFTTSDIFEVIV